MRASRLKGSYCYRDNISNYFSAFIKLAPVASVHTETECVYGMGQSSLSVHHIPSHTLIFKTVPQLKSLLEGHGMPRDGNVERLRK